MFTPLIIIGVIAGVGLAIAGLFRPFVGLLLLVVIHFMQPGELIPSLAPFRPELVYGVLLAVSFVLRRASSPHRPLFSNRIFLGAILVLGAAVLSIPFAVWRGGALSTTIMMAKLIAILFFLSELTDTNDRLRKVLWILVGMQAWFAVSALLAFREGEFVRAQNLDRASGLSSVVGGPNELAGLIMGLMPFLIALILSSRSLLIRLVLLACGGIGVAAMVLTGSRASMLALVAMAIYYALRSRNKLLSLVGVALLFCTIWLIMPKDYQERYVTVKQYAEGGELDDSNRARLQIWRAGWRMFLDHPILGVGAGQFRVAYGTVYSGRAHGPWANPHNLFLQVVCEMGVIGLLAFAYFLSQIIKRIRSILKLRGKQEFKLNYDVAVACSAMLLAVLGVSVVGHTLYRPYFYLLGGLVAANRFVADQVEKSEVGSAPGERVRASRQDESLLAPETVLVNGKT